MLTLNCDFLVLYFAQPMFYFMSSMQENWDSRPNSPALPQRYYQPHDRAPNRALGAHCCQSRAPCGCSQSLQFSQASCGYPGTLVCLQTPCSTIETAESATRSLRIFPGTLPPKPGPGSQLLQIIPLKFTLRPADPRWASCSSPSGSCYDV